MGAAAFPAPIEAKRSGPPPWIAIGMVVLFGAFGVTTALALFCAPQQQARPPPAPVVIQMPATAAPVATTTPTVTDDTPATATSATKAGTGVARNTAGTTGAKPPAAAPAGAAVDPSIAALLK